ncbi:NADP-dependent isocitrate dehydrogenase, partial [Burkholderia multivorans]
GEWSPNSKTNVATMGADDFRANEQSVVMDADDTLSIVLVTESGDEVVLKDSLPVLAGEVVDATKMNVAALDEFLRAQIQRAKDEGILFSVHLKATMMKVSDPILFGHVIEAFFPEVFAEYG